MDAVEMFADQWFGLNEGFDRLAGMGTGPESRRPGQLCPTTIRDFEALLWEILPANQLNGG